MTEPSKVNTRLAAPADAEPMARIARDAYAHYTSRIGRPPAPVTADYAAQIADGVVWVAQDGAELLGLLVLLDRPDHLLLENIAVGPGAQGRGVGGSLLELAEQRAWQRGHREVRLYTNAAMTENLDYYPRRGYVDASRRAGRLSPGVLQQADLLSAQSVWW